MKQVENNGLCRSTGLRGRPGTTLVEILGVMIIIAVLMGLVLGVGAVVGRMQDKARAQMHLEHLKSIVESYRQDKRELPQQASISSTPTMVLHQTNDKLLVESAKESGVPMSKSGSNYYPVDPWGQPFFYERLDPNGTSGLGRFSYRMGSKGPDGRYGKGSSSVSAFGQGDDLL